MKAYGGVDVQIHIFLTSALAGVEWSASRPGRITPGTPWTRGWVDPRAGLDDVKKKEFLTLPGLELRPLGALDSPARSESLYRLLYPVCLIRRGWGKFLANFRFQLSCCSNRPQSNNSLHWQGYTWSKLVDLLPTAWLFIEIILMTSNNIIKLAVLVLLLRYKKLRLLSSSPMITALALFWHVKET
jgi:hypothetical protein